MKGCVSMYYMKHVRFLDQNTVTWAMGMVRVCSIVVTRSGHSSADNTPVIITTALNHRPADVDPRYCRYWAV